MTFRHTALVRFISVCKPTIDYDVCILPSSKAEILEHVSYMYHHSIIKSNKSSFDLISADVSISLVAKCIQYIVHFVDKCHKPSETGVEETGC